MTTATTSITLTQEHNQYCNTFVFFLTVDKVNNLPKGMFLPRPTLLHHIVEDFLTSWTSPQTHILPLRRFLEACIETDLRSFFVHSCMKFALTGVNVPLYCEQHYLNPTGGALLYPESAFKKIKHDPISAASR